MAQDSPASCDVQWKSISVQSRNKWLIANMHPKEKLSVALTGTRCLSQQRNKDNLKARCFGGVEGSPAAFFSLFI